MKKLNLNHNEIIILSVVIGVFMALIMGYVFSSDYYIDNGGHKVYGQSEYYTVSSEFNYILSFGSFIIVSGISYLYLNKRGFPKKDKNEVSEKINDYNID